MDIVDENYDFYEELVEDSNSSFLFVLRSPSGRVTRNDADIISPAQNTRRKSVYEVYYSRWKFLRVRKMENASCSSIWRCTFHIRRNVPIRISKNLTFLSILFS